MQIELKSYYLNDFRKDLPKIQFTQGNQVTNHGDFFFDKQRWIDALRTIASGEQKACFVFSMFITVASDQTMFAYFHPYYRTFRLLTRYPKFGWCGLGPHNLNPLLLIKYPLDESLIEIADVKKYLESAANLFVDEVKDFLINHMNSINPKEFVTKFISDRYIVQIASEDANMKEFIGKIDKAINNC